MSGTKSPSTADPSSKIVFEGHTWDNGSFWIGVVIGMIIFLIIVWICYNTRTFLFTFCARNTPGCVNTDYYNDPGEALGHDPRLTASDILYLNNEEEMMYVRVPKVNTCIPEANQTIQIIYPEYCNFINEDYPNGLEYRQTHYGSNIYQPTGGSGPANIMTDKNCDPKADSGFTSGIPLIKWDPTTVK